MNYKSEFLFWQWIKVKDRLPEDDKQVCLFVIFMENGFIVESYYNTWENVKNYRKYELENYYTHWIPIEPPKVEVRRKRENKLSDKLGHHNFYFCPGCGKKWGKDSESFGCWSCGFVK